MKINYYPKFQKYITFVIKNKTDKTKKANIFGDDIYDDIEIRSCECSYDFIKNLITNHNIEFSGLKYISTTAMQMKNKICIGREVPFGIEENNITIEHEIYRKKDQVNECQFDIDKIKFKIGQFDRLRLSLIPDEEVTILLRVKSIKKIK